MEGGSGVVFIFSTCLTNLIIPWITNRLWHLCGYHMLKMHTVDKVKTSVLMGLKPFDHTCIASSLHCTVWAQSWSSKSSKIYSKGAKCQRFSISFSAIECDFDNGKYWKAIAVGCVARICSELAFHNVNSLTSWPFHVVGPLWLWVQLHCLYHLLLCSLLFVHHWGRRDWLSAEGSEGLTDKIM